MSELETRMPRLEVDAWERRLLRMKQFYIDRGMSDSDADDKATSEVRRQIITGETIRTGR